MSQPVGGKGAKGLRASLAYHNAVVSVRLPQELYWELVCCSKMQRMASYFEEVPRVPPRVPLFTVGHAKLQHPNSVPHGARAPPPPLTRQQLAYLNFLRSTLARFTNTPQAAAAPGVLSPLC